MEEGPFERHEHWPPHEIGAWPLLGAIWDVPLVSTATIAQAFLARVRVPSQLFPHFAGSLGTGEMGG